MKTIPTNPIAFRQALEANVRKATAVVATKKATSKDAKAKKKAAPQLPLIERQIRSIATQLQAVCGKSMTIVREQPSTGSSCAGMVAMFDSAALAAFEQEKKEFARLLKTGQADPRLRPVQPAAIERYAFYATSLDSTRLGSVAIYGPNAVQRLLKIKRDASFFGHRMASAKVELGRRPFVDITLIDDLFFSPSRAGGEVG